VAASTAAGIGAFDYSDKVRSGRVEAKVHDLLDPTVKAGDASPFKGTVMRECVITPEHPNPTPIAIMLDVTGSNHKAAHKVHAKLPQLFGLLQRKGLIEDPQILIGANGDATCDRIPLQVGQFESDNRIDDMVEAMVLEGGGGGGNHETYELSAYYLARHTHLEPYHKQGRKGYAIFIGDEKCYPTVKRDFKDGFYGTSHTLESLTGDVLQEDVPTEQIFEELKEQYEVFFIFCKESSYVSMLASQKEFWQNLVGEGWVELDSGDNICEFIAGLLAMREGGLELDEVEGALADAGFDPAAIKSTSKTLAHVGGSGGVAKTEGSLDVDDSEGTERL
jgi:hypothetical protein